MYTKSYDEDLLKKIGNEEKRFTSQEHSYSTEKQIGREFSSKEALLRYFLQNCSSKLCALALLINIIKEKNYKNIISLGAGSCVLEYLLKYSVSEDSLVVATDYDSFSIKKAKEYFPSIVACEYDFVNEDINEVTDKIKPGFDIAVFFASSYIMDDNEFVKVFSGLRKSGVKSIVDFQPAFISYKEIPREIFFIIKKIARKIKIINKIKPEAYKGKFHGYARTRNEFRRLYEKAGYKIEKETKAGCYPYVAIIS